MSLTNPGNCILRALSRFAVLSPDVLTTLQNPRDPANVAAARRGHRTHRACADMCGVRLRAGFSDCIEPGRYLLHTEDGGRPHCVAVTVCNGMDNTSVWNGDRQMRMDTGVFKQCLHEGLDSKTAVLFRVLTEQDQAAGDTDFTEDEIDALLDLAAGAGDHALLHENESTGDGSASDADCPGIGDPHQKDDACDAADEAVVFVRDTILSELEREVASAVKSVREGRHKRDGTVHGCPLCPFRSFNNKHRNRLIQHIRAYHTDRQQFCCSGTKQMKVILALFDDDKLTRRKQGNYLARSAAVLRGTVQPELPSTVNNINKYMRLVLTGSGPQYYNRDTVFEASNLRRVRNLYYNQAFAEIVFRECLLCGSRVRAVIQRLLLRFAEAGSKLGSLMTERHLWPIVTDIVKSPVVTKLYHQLMDEAMHHQEFQSVSVDCTMKCCMPLMGQASWRAPIAERAAAAFPDGESVRCVLSLRGRTSAVMGLWPLSKEDTTDVCRALRTRLELKWRKQVRYVASDAPSAKLQKGLCTVFPTLQALSLDPVHLAITYEYATWRQELSCRYRVFVVTTTLRTTHSAVGSSVRPGDVWGLSLGLGLPRASR